MHKRLMAFLIEQNVLNKQFDFQKISTAQAIINLSENIEKVIDSKLCLWNLH